MSYKKINFDQNRKETMRAIMKACRVVKKEVSSGTEHIADVWIEHEKKKGSKKAKAVKEQTVLMMKRISYHIKKSFKGVTMKAAIRDLSYEFGQASRETMDNVREMIKGIKK